MCYVIVTSRTLLWTLLSIAITLAMLAAIITPSWLVGPQRQAGLKSKVTRLSDDKQNGTRENIYAPSLGIYNRCTKLHKLDQLYTDSCAPFVTDFSQSSDSFPHFWKASLICFGMGVLIMTLTIIMSLLSCCFRSICRKSIFTISGTIQAVAGLFYVLGLISYPAGWGSKRVELVCGKSSDMFWLGECQIGWALYLAIGGTFGTFICAILSVQADISTSTDKVQDEILEGKSLICLI